MGSMRFGPCFANCVGAKKIATGAPFVQAPRATFVALKSAPVLSDFEQDDEDVGYQVTNSSAQFIQSVSSDQLILWAPPIYHDLVHSADKVRGLVS